MTIVGQMAIKNIKDLEFDKADNNCLIVSNFKISWTLCAASKSEAQEWFCSVKYALRTPCDGKSGSDSSSNESKEIKEIEGK